MTATVSIRDVSHRFGDFLALDNINLTIESGSFAVLLGPSGCGKTTLLSVLGGFLTPSQGQVLLNDTDVTHVPPARRPTTTMFQDYALFPHMTLLNNVGFGLRMRGQRKSQRNAKAHEMLALVGLADSANRRPHELSGGQRQRVALARALAVDPDVLLLDEPLGALDLKLRRQMQDELKAIQRGVGTTFVHVTHDQEEAMAIADQIVVMNAGQIMDSGTPESIYLNPRTLFSAAFMGETNTVQGVVTNTATDGFTVQTALGEAFLPNKADVNANISTGASVGFCFRPEHVRLTPHRREDAPPDVSLGDMTLLDHAFFGTHQRCHLLASDDRQYVANLPQDLPLENGQILSPCVDASLAVLLLSQGEATDETGSA